MTLFFAWISVAVLAVLLGLGTLITTYRVGMVDPIWPTEPWFLISNWREPSAGYLIEHTHRVAAYMAGITILAVTLSAWRKSPIAIGAIPLILVSVGLAIAMTSITTTQAMNTPVTQTEANMKGTITAILITSHMNVWRRSAHTRNGKAMDCRTLHSKDHFRRIHSDQSELYWNSEERNEMRPK